MTRGSVQAGNRESKTEHYLQCWNSSQERDAVTSAADKLCNPCLFSTWLLLLRSSDHMQSIATHTHTHFLTFTTVYSYNSTHTCIHKHTHMYIYRSAYVEVCIQPCSYACMYWVHVCMHACMCVCMHGCMYTYTHLHVLHMYELVLCFPYPCKRKHLKRHPNTRT